MHLDILMVIKYNYCIKLPQSEYQRGDLVQKRIEKYYDLIVEYLYPNMSENKKVDESSKFKVEVTEPILISYEDVAINSERQLKRLNAYEKAVRSIVSTPELNKLGLQSREIAELVEAGLVERVKQGYYTLPEISGEDSEAKMIWELYPDGVICMTTALFYYKYINRTPLAWDIAIDRNASKARFNLDYLRVDPHFMEKSHLTYGVTKANYEDCLLNIFDRDRLICECIKHENKMDREIFNKAIQGYVNDQEKNIANLMEYAERRNIHKKVRERISIWL